jgi:hypothetical protein
VGAPFVTITVPFGRDGWMMHMYLWEARGAELLAVWRLLSGLVVPAVTPSLSPLPGQGEAATTKIRDK